MILLKKLLQFLIIGTLLPLLVACSLDVQVWDFSSKKSNELPSEENPNSGPLITFSGPEYLKPNTTYEYTVSLSEPSLQDITVNYTTEEGQAVSPFNFIHKSGSVVITAGNTSANFEIFTSDEINGPGVFKDFKLKLTATTEGLLSQPVKVLRMGVHELNNVLDITHGGNNRCVLLNNNEMRCWGFPLPEKLPTMKNIPVAKVVSNNGAICILTFSGGVKCSGNNSSGILGDGTNTDSLNTFVDVVGLSSGVTDIQLGSMSACALLSTGNVKCWGNNLNGRLGNGTTLASNIPVDVSGLTNVQQISLIDKHTCAVLADGSLKCWGANLNRQLGNGTAIDQLEPVDVTGVTGVKFVSAGSSSTCAVLNTHLAKCWGSNLYGLLGDGTTVARTTPVDVVGVSNINNVFVGYGHACALLFDGSVKCWGMSNFGQLGDGTQIHASTAVSVVGLPGTATKLSLNSDTTCALMSSGKVFCWGNNEYGKIGDGKYKWEKLYPSKISSTSNDIVKAAKGKYHVCVVLLNTGLQCWGYNINSELGDGTTTTRTSPVNVNGLTSGVLDVAATVSSTCALLSTGGVKCWGSNAEGRLGDGTFISKSTPVDVSGLTSGVTAISAGQHHVCALLNTGAVKCWGRGAYGRLGNGSTANSNTPVDVTGLSSGVTQISSGYAGSCAIQGGLIKCWGLNDFGQLGNNTYTNSPTPQTVTGISSGATQVTVGEFSTCAIVNGGAKCWGSNYEGELGANSNVDDSPVPLDVFGLTSGVVDIYASGDDYSGYACALLTGGKMQCWGSNEWSSLGNNDFKDTNKPLDVIALNSGVSSIVKGFGGHNCVIKTNQEIHCWGDNTNNRIGPTATLTPQQVFIGQEDL